MQLKEQKTKTEAEKDIFYRLLVILLKLYKGLGIALIAAAFLVLIVNFTPDLYYYVDAGAVNSENDLLLNTVSAQTLTPKQPQFIVAKKLPDVDPALPNGLWLIIPKIGVNGQIHIGGSGEKGLDQGVWQPDDFGDPLSDIPMLLASHRYGLLSWSNDFRTKNSFYRLPDLQPNDEIIVIFQQRAFKYKVTSKFESKKIENVKADMILYTCKFFRSPDRVILTADKAW